MKKFKIVVQEDRSTPGNLKLVRVEHLVDAETKIQAKEIARQKSDPVFLRFIKSYEVGGVSDSLPVFRIKGYWKSGGRACYMTLIVAAKDEESAKELVRGVSGYGNSDLTVSQVGRKPGIILEKH